MKASHLMIALIFGLFSYDIAATPVELLGEYNLIVFNDLNSTSEVEGKTLVGGNVSGPASNYGTRLSANSADKNALVIGGNLSYGTTVNINNGQNIKVTGNANGNINLNGGGSFSSDTSSYNFSQIQSELTSFSTYLSGLSSNSSLTAPVVCCQAASFDVGDVNNDVAVFNISDSDFFSNRYIQQYDVDLNGQDPSAIIINVSGTSINDSMFSGNAVGSIFSDELREKIIWNFYEAKEINLTKILNGSLLAPLAILTNWTPIEGSVIVNSFNQWGEVHQHTFDGDLTVEVLEPSTILMFVFGFLIVAFYRYSTKQRILVDKERNMAAI